MDLVDILMKFFQICEVSLMVLGGLSVILILALIYINRKE